jgi:hypothetical protein
LRLVRQGTMVCFLSTMRPGLSQDGLGIMRDRTNARLRKGSSGETALRYSNQRESPCHRQSDRGLPLSGVYQRCSVTHSRTQPGRTTAIASTAVIKASTTSAAQTSAGDQCQQHLDADEEQRHRLRPAHAGQGTPRYVTIVSGPNNEPILSSLIATRPEVLPQHLVPLVDVGAQAVRVVALGMAGGVVGLVGLAGLRSGVAAGPRATCPNGKDSSCPAERKCAPNTSCFRCPKRSVPTLTGNCRCTARPGACEHHFGSRTKTVAPIESS